MWPDPMFRYAPEEIPDRISFGLIMQKTEPAQVRCSTCAGPD
jgi:hypothetical protein